MPRAVCPDCDEQVLVSGVPKIGQIVYCSSCDARLEVVEIDPLELDWALDDDDDYPDDDWDDDEDD